MQQRTLRIVLTVSLLVVCGRLPAQPWEATGQGFVWRTGTQYVRFDQGRWTAGLEGGREITWHTCLQHDQWVYETIPGGKIDAGPTLQPDGTLMMHGTFSARNDSAPVQYTYAIRPESGGLRVRGEFQKTGPLALNAGIRLHIHTDREKFSGDERVWLEPTWHGTISAAAHSVAERFHLELEPGRSVCLGGGPSLVTKDSYTQNPAYLINWVGEDFAVGRTVAAEYVVSFAELPRHFPDDVLPQRQPLALGQVEPTPAPVPLYGKFELEVPLTAAYDNPYDPDDVALEAVFTSPSGQEHVVPGFFAVGYQRRVVNGSELMVPQAAGGWKIRFAPREIGRYTWRLRLRDRSGQTTGGEGAFSAVAAKTPGFVRVSPADPHYLAFDNGQGYFAIGHNLPIYHTTQQLGDEAMRRFARAGENFNRWWMSSSGFGIEWMPRLGWYRQDVASRLDMVLDLAEQAGLYYMLCLDTHQDFRENGWVANPFNAKNGGPCQTPRDWFTDAQAKQFYKHRLRYTVARWGYSPHVLCWEFGNEFEGWADSPNEVKLPWHREMSDYLRSIDPFGHLITTSFWGHTGPEEFWQLPNIDIVQTHLYTNNDANVAEPVREYCLQQWKRFAKPHIFGEFGIRSHASTADKDPKGWGIHNALWAGLTSFAAGGPMPWWHESYIDKLDLYFHFTALAHFTNGLPLGTAPWIPLETSTPKFVDPNHRPELRDAVITPEGRWGRPEHNEFVIQPDGTVADDRRPLQLLHGQGHPDLRDPPTFVVDYPQPGKFTVRVGRVSRSGRLLIWVDDQAQLEQDLPCDRGLGKESVYREQWKLWETVYDQDFSVEVPAGRHRIRVDNQGGDWATVMRYVFAGCQVRDKPDVLIAGIKTDQIAVLWLQNRDSCWYNQTAGKVPPVEPFALVLTGLNDGRYRLQWWDTWHGQVRKTEEVRVACHQLSLTVASLPSDVALKLERLP